jgi:D-beta-D-heptose 7-phosphate kinase/D-beta-D-heptose 1-phosphate adenosyltransferase
MAGLRMKTIFVNGTFDILHRGHLEMLEYAASIGEHLLIALDTDRRVKELKGDSRPINNQADRVYMMYRIKGVKSVMLFDTDEELARLIKITHPDVMVKGSDWRGKPIIGEQYCKEIKFYERVGDYSTTNIIQHIADR